MPRSVRVGIVDDSEDARTTLVQHLAEFEKHNDVKCSITEFADGYELVEHYRPDLDILFIDVQMPGLDGFATATAIREIDSQLIIVFVTNMSQYATRGYAVDALSYLLKPVTYFAFQVEMTRCLRQLERTKREALVVKSGSTIRRVDLSDIIYVESVKHRIILHTVDEVISYSGTLKASADALADKGFYRSNNCYLVNLQHVRGISGDDAEMSNGDQLKISRPRKSGFMEALTSYLGGQLV